MQHSVLEHLTIDAEQPAFQHPRTHYLPPNQLKVHPAAIPNVVRAIVSNVQIQRCIAVDICQCHGCAAKLACGAGHLSAVSERTVAVVHETKDTVADGGNQQIKPAVAVEIGKDRASAELCGGGEACFFGHVQKFPLPQILIEDIPLISPQK